MLGKPLVWGIHCPRCATEHLLGSLGVKVHSPKGDEVDFPPTLAAMSADPETNVVTTLCLSCHREFQFQILVLDPPSDEDVVYH